MRLINIYFNRLVNLAQKGMYHAAIDENELQDEVDTSERNVTYVKNTLDNDKVDDSNSQGTVVSTHGSRNRKEHFPC